MRTIAVITGTRAEYGQLYWILKAIHEDPELTLQLIITGMHLSPEFGKTADVIDNDGFPIAERVEMLLSSDTEEAIALSMGVGVMGFANAYRRLRPDLILVLGDRFEIFAAVAASVPFHIPVAHIHGGELTFGVMDESFRHAITKMSYYHFPATQAYADRIIQMGEAPERVFCCGAPGLDNLLRLDLLQKEQVLEALNLPASQSWGVMTYHPVAGDKQSVEAQINEVLSALQKVDDVFWIFTLPNADTGGRIIIRRLEEFVKAHPQKGTVFSSLGQLRYLSLLQYATVMVGNSSSGLTEAPSFRLPVINIGDRQQGRVRAKNVLDIPDCRKEGISTALRKALSPEFKTSLQGMTNPYGEGNASQQIVDILKRCSLGPEVRKKIFYNLPGKSE